MVARDVTDDGEPEPGTTRAAIPRPVHPVEPLEDAIEVLRRDADPMIGHHDVDPGVLDLCRDIDLRSRIAVLHAVVDQVHHRRHQLVTVALDPGVRRSVWHAQPHAVALGLGEDPIAGARQQLAHGDEPTLVGLVRLDAAEVKKVLDESTGTLRLSRDPLSESAGHGRVALLCEGLREQTEGPDRRPELVVHIRYEVAADGVEPPALAGVDEDTDDAAGDQWRREDVDDASR